MTMASSGSERRFVRLVLASILGLALAVGPRSALAAEPSAADKETARSLVLSGRDKRKSGDLQGALEDFERAHTIMGVPTTGLELGKAQIALGLLVEARTTLLDVSRYRERSDEPEPFKRARREAKPLADALLPRLATVNLELENVPSGFTPKVTIDGHPALAVSGPLKLNPGKHEIVAAVGDEEKRAVVEVDEGGTDDVTLKFSGEVPDTASSASSDPARGPSSTGDEPASGHSKLLLYAGIATAGAGVLVGSVTGLLAFSEYTNVTGCRNNQCPPPTHDAIDRGMMFGNVSTVSFIIAGIGAAAAVVALLLPPPEPDVATRPARDDREDRDPPRDDASEEDPPPEEASRARARPRPMAKRPAERPTIIATPVGIFGTF